MTTNPLDRCNRCGVAAREPRWDRPGIALTRHHIIPRSQGGPNTKDNIEILCWPCHAREHGQTVKDTAHLYVKPSESGTNRNGLRRRSFTRLGKKMRRLITPSSDL